MDVCLTSALVGGESSASCPGRFIPGKSVPVTHWIDGWAPEPVWTTWKGYKPCPYRDSNSDPSAVQSVASSYTDCAIPAPTRERSAKLIIIGSKFELKNYRF
jgi:hypothetical protein